MLETRSASAEKAVWLIALSKKILLGVPAIELQKAGSPDAPYVLQTTTPLPVLAHEPLLHPGPRAPIQGARWPC